MNPMPNASEAAGKPLQLYVWHSGDRFIFIASTGGTYDLVKEQPVAAQTLNLLRKQFESLTGRASQQRRLASQEHNGTILASVRSLGTTVRRVVLHPDLRDLLDEGGYSDIVISSNEYTIPWELIFSRESYLSLQCPLTRRLQSARPVPKASRVLFRQRLKVLLVYDPTGDLPGTQTEAAEIQKLFADEDRFELTSLTGREFNRFEMLELMTQADIFHFAGHAKFNSERPKESGLQLADGLLLASEIENYLADAAPILVFINACESMAFGDSTAVLNGADMAGLAHPFISSGCGAVLGSSLPVADTQAATFATLVYQRFVNGETLSNSVWKARKTSVDLYGVDDPTWSAFLLFGDGGLRVVVESIKANITPQEIRASRRQAALWIRNERSEAGRWCDRVYRTQAAMNTAEAILALTSAEETLNADEVHSSLAELLHPAASDYSAAPYEPEHLGIFTSCLCYVSQALLQLLDYVPPQMLEDVHAKLKEIFRELLDLQLSSGAWNWGGHFQEVSGYTLFTVEALEALQASVSHGFLISDRVGLSISKGLDYLRSSQLANGGWAFKGGVEAADATSTCYVLEAMLASGADLDDETIKRGLLFLRSSIDLAQLSDEQFFIDHRIEVPGVPRSAWPHFEDYSGLGGFCSLLLAAPDIESYLGSSGLRRRLLRRILDGREPNMGWPRSYPTIYVTNFFINVLSLALEADF